LLQETNQLDGIVFVGFWQIDVFQVDDQALAFFWPVNTALGVCGLGAHLVQLLNYVESCGLGVTVNNGQLGRLHLFDQTANHQIFAAAFWSYKNETFIFF